jgi:hypothetical protein
VAARRDPWRLAASPLTDNSPVYDPAPEELAAKRGAAEGMAPALEYGQLKATCELAARQAFGNDCLILRPGVVLGPYEYVGRLPWILNRMHRGGQVLAAGDPDRAIQPVDVRDLTAFILRPAAPRPGRRPRQASRSRPAAGRRPTPRHRRSAPRPGRPQPRTGRCEGEPGLRCLAAAQQDQPAKDPHHDQVQQTDRHKPRSCRNPPAPPNRSSPGIRRVLERYRLVDRTGTCGVPKRGLDG